MLVRIIFNNYISVNDIYELYEMKDELIEQYFNDIISFRRMSSINTLFEFLINKIINMYMLLKYYKSSSYENKLLKICKNDIMMYRKKLEYIYDVGSPCIIEEENNDITDIYIYGEKMADDFFDHDV